MRAFCAIMKAAAAMLLAAVVAVGWYKIGWQAAAIAAAAVSAAYVIFKGAAPEEEEDQDPPIIKCELSRGKTLSINFNAKTAGEVFVSAAVAAAGVCTAAAKTCTELSAEEVLAEAHKILDSKSEYVKAEHMRTVNLNEVER